MMKKVNGKVIEIRDFDLFIDADMGRLTRSGIESAIDIEIEDKHAKIISVYLHLYRIIYKAIPYPLCDIENDIKYAAICEVIQNKTDGKINIWVDGAIFVELSCSLVLKIKADSWCIVKHDGRCGCKSDIKKYKEFYGFSHYVWVVKNLISGVGTREYYKEFMPEMVKACNNDIGIINKELLKILNIINIPVKMDYRCWGNGVIELKSGVSIKINIYKNGVVVGTKNIYRSDGKKIDKVEEDIIKVKYDYETYVDNTGKIKLLNNNKTVLGVIASDIISIEKRRGRKVINYSGVIIEDRAIYTIDNTLFLFDGEKSELLCNKVDIVGVKSGIVYIEKTEYSNKVKRISTYYIDIKSKDKYLCNIRHSL